MFKRQKKAYNKFNNRLDNFLVPLKNKFIFYVSYFFLSFD